MKQLFLKSWTILLLFFFGLSNVNAANFLENAAKVNVVQISTWMEPKDGAWTGKPYVSDSQGFAVYSNDAAADSTKWYEIPAGGSVYDQQVYYYKNVATGTYLKGSATPPGAGDWTVSAATTSVTNEGTDLFKWSKKDSNWDNGPWLVNEENNAGTAPSGENKNAFFALTSLNLNATGGEFFGVTTPNVAISNPHVGDNPWTAVQITVAATGVTNPDYVPDGSLEYSIEALNFFAHDGGEDPGAASYDKATHTITYNDGWRRVGWNWEDEGGIDVSAYDQVWIKFDASALPTTGDGEGGATKLQFDVFYMDDTDAATLTSKEHEIRATDTEFFYNLTPGKLIKRITLKSEASGDVVLTDAYFFSKGIDPVDLIITDLTWTPENPVLGEDVRFSATIKNNSEFASQDVKHGVVFSVSATSGTSGTLIAWSDTHLTALQPGEEVTVTANGGPNDADGTWKPAAARTFYVTAFVNDQNDVLESDVTNNKLEKEIVVSPLNSIKDVALDGKVFAANGKLHLVNYPENAVVTIYNMLSQKIGVFKASEVSNFMLPTNLYIVIVQDGNKYQSLKVVVK
ncbi:MAG: hypothetical protein EZS26_000661 [Candidatus Ordinivivax streblomastigis]|uniref:CARDB domain-containing protein n=1 Tax=Candidatus Ordinivivax streblomastigis TaxID=2540710 RepID=A0A5M8P3U4_9BACT|nr:MAG: hypothetical protein EZS26_000661 [Candidatus Ordinivivax streblomastigis]